MGAGEDSLSKAQSFQHDYHKLQSYVTLKEIDETFLQGGRTKL